MTEAKRSFWRRTVPIAAFGVLWMVGVTEGCGGGDEAGPTSGPGPTSSSSSMGGMGGMGGSTGSSLCVEPAASGAADFRSPTDSTPDPAGNTIYFTALDANGDGAILSVPAGGGATTVLAHGAPLQSPFGIAIDDAGKTLYIADPAAETDPAKPRGAIFTLSTNGGAPSAIAATADYAPRGVEVAKQNGADVVYFTGTDPTSSSKKGVFSVSGGAVSAVVTTLVDPVGLAIATNGDIYVSDSISAGTGNAEVKLVKGGSASTFVSDIPVGFPAGVALSQDEKSLYLSGLDPVTKSDVVYEIDVASKAVTAHGGKLGGGSCANATDISQSFEAAGIHRAKGTNVFSWADSAHGASAGNGAVYRVQFN